MISFGRQGIRSRYGAAGLAVHDGYVPPTKPDQDEHYIHPCRRFELGEDARATLRRETLE